uniref:Uncharacterized protein n=1 Tax=Rattus norvegicus TaxID=10116 RepID=A0ABK0M5U0_RAT
MAHVYVNCKIHSGKAVLFIISTCPYFRNTQDFLSQLLCKYGLLGFEDITSTNNTNVIQDYLHQLTGVRTVPWAFKGQKFVAVCLKPWGRKFKRQQRFDYSVFIC